MNFKTLDEVKQAVLFGDVVYWKNHSYAVIVDRIGQFMIKCNGHYVGVTDEYNPEDFFVEGN